MIPFRSLSFYYIFAAHPNPVRLLNVPRRSLSAECVYGVVGGDDLCARILLVVDGLLQRGEGVVVRRQQHEQSVSELLALSEERRKRNEWGWDWMGWDRADKLK